MALKIVTGGTTGAADGTLVSSGNPLVIVALNTAIDAHIRCDDGYWTATELFDFTAAYNLQVSFASPWTTWYGSADEPVTAPEIYAVNVPIKIRQTAAAASTSGSIITNNSTYTAIAALSTPTLTATLISSTQIDLSWTNVSNEDASPGYTLQRSTAADFSADLVTVTKDVNVTTHSATGLTNPTTYYFRVKAEGSGRYSDSAYGSANATTSTFTLVAADDFVGATGLATSHTPSGTGAHGTWSKGYGAVGTDVKLIGNGRIRTGYPGGGGAGATAGIVHSDAISTGKIEMSIYIASKDGSEPYMRLNGNSGYAFIIDLTATVTCKIVRNGVQVGSTVNLSFNVGDTFKLTGQNMGGVIKLFIDDVEKISYTDGSPITTSTGPQIEMYQANANSDTVGGHVESFASYSG